MADQEEEIDAELEVSASALAAIIWPALLAIPAFKKALASDPMFLQALTVAPIFGTGASAAVAPSTGKAIGTGISR